MNVKRLNNHKNLSDMGNKCRNLAQLTELGFNVPQAYGLTFSAFAKFIEPLVSEIESIIQMNGCKTGSRMIRKLIVNSSIPKTVRQDIEGLTNYFSSETKLAVRSSGMVIENGEALMEDANNKSLAGQYESFLNVSNGSILNAVKLCWASLFNERSLHVFNAKNNDTFLESKMSVVVQEMILADASAVMMTQDPLEKEPMLAMETTYGPCEAIVSGKVTGDLITIDRKSMQVCSKIMGSKKSYIYYSPFNIMNNGNYQLIQNSDEMRSQFAVDDEIALRIARVGLEIEKKFGSPQDIELVVNNGKIFVVQTRNITTSIH